MSIRDVILKCLFAMLSRALLSGGGLEVLVGGVLVAVHLHVRHVPLLGAGALVNLHEALENEKN